MAKKRNEIPDKGCSWIDRTPSLMQIKWVFGFDSQVDRTEISEIRLPLIKINIIKYLTSFPKSADNYGNIFAIILN